MPARPLLRLPAPIASTPPKGSARFPKVRLPSPGHQRDAYGPLFRRLRDVLSREKDGLALREDPSSLAPDRVIVFEIAGTIQNFLKAIARIDGLEFMAEYEDAFEPDENFAVQE